MIYAFIAIVIVMIVTGCSLVRNWPAVVIDAEKIAEDSAIAGAKAAEQTAVKEIEEDLK